MIVAQRRYVGDASSDSSGSWLDFILGATDVGTAMDVATQANTTLAPLYGQIGNANAYQAALNQIYAALAAGQITAQQAQQQIANLNGAYQNQAQNNPAGSLSTVAWLAIGGVALIALIAALR
jgi:hypothetical protein